MASPDPATRDRRDVHRRQAQTAARRIALDAITRSGPRSRRARRNSSRLLSRLGEAFGGGTGLVDVGSGKARDQTLHPDVDPSLSLPNVARDASRPSLLEDHSKHNSVAEVVDLLKLELQLLIHAEPALNEGTNRRLAFEDVPQRPPLKDRIDSKAAHHRIDITAIRGLKLPAHTLHRVGGRGLLRHLAASIPYDAT